MLALISWLSLYSESHHGSSWLMEPFLSPVISWRTFSAASDQLKNIFCRQWSLKNLFCLPVISWREPFLSLSDQLKNLFCCQWSAEEPFLSASDQLKNLFCRQWSAEEPFLSASDQLKNLFCRQWSAKEPFLSASDQLLMDLFILPATSWSEIFCCQ
jgi:hypothetical protein